MSTLAGPAAAVRAIDAIRHQSPCKHRKTARCPSELVELEHDWREAAALMKGPTARHSWSRAAAEAFASERGLHVTVTGRDGRPVAIAPLTPRRIFRMPHSAMLGVHELHEPMDLIYRDESALEQLADDLVRDGAPLFLERVPEQSPTTAAFQRLGRRRAVVVVRPHPGCPYIELDQTWQEPESHLTSRRRSDLRRAHRHAEQIGAIDTRIITPKTSELDDLMDTALRIEAANWKGRSGTALLHDPQRATFFRTYARLACAEGILRLCFLRIGDTPAAVQLAVECGGGFWLLKVGYDQAFAQCSPGNLLMRHTIRYAAERNLATYEFLGSISPWTQTWTNLERRCVSIWVYPMSLRGMTAIACAAAAKATRRWRKT